MTTLESGISRSSRRGTLSLLAHRFLTCCRLQAFTTDAIARHPSPCQRTTGATLSTTRPFHFRVASMDFEIAASLLGRETPQGCFWGNGSLLPEPNHRARPWYQHSRAENLCRARKWQLRTRTSQPCDCVPFCWWFRGEGRLVFHKRIY